MTATGLEPCAVFADLTDEAWLRALIGSIGEPTARGVRLPAFPAESVQRQFNGACGEQTLREAYDFYRLVKSYALRCGRPIRRGSVLLDFGCGWGRLTRFFLKDAGSADIHGMDVDPVIIEQCRRSFPPGRFEVVGPAPPAPSAEATYDVIYLYSVFTHLNEETHLQWLREFARLLKPGGLLLATTQGRGFIDWCSEQRAKDAHESVWHRGLARCFADRDRALSDYDAGRFLHAPTGGGDFRPPSFYGETLIPRGYVERTWTRYLDFVDFQDDRARLQQALIVMRKRPQPR